MSAPRPRLFSNTSRPYGNKAGTRAPVPSTTFENQKNLMPMIATLPSPVSTNPKFIIRGIHLGISDPMKNLIEAKADRLFRHEPQILRLRVDVERDHRGGPRRFVAKGHIELPGPDLQASVITDDAYKSAHLLIDKLDRMLRKRTTALTKRRHEDDIRAYARQH
jgi:putative sigma-54 modulation protein